MTACRTHYDNLKVTRDAPPEVIRAAYRALALKYHSDRNPHPDSARIMKIINAAYEVLGDPERRREYDQQLPATDDAPSGDARAEHSKGAPDRSPPRRPTRNETEWARFAMLQKMMDAEGIECIHCHSWLRQFRCFTGARKIPYVECHSCSGRFTASEYDNYTARNKTRSDHPTDNRRSGRHRFRDGRCAVCRAIDSGPDAWAATCHR